MLTSTTTTIAAAVATATTEYWLQKVDNTQIHGICNPIWNYKLSENSIL